MTVDEERFEHLMEEQRERARAAQKEGTLASGPGEVDDFQRRTAEVRADFVGYERLEVYTVVRACGELADGRVAVGGITLLRRGRRAGGRHRLDPH